MAFEADRLGMRRGHLQAAEVAGARLEVVAALCGTEDDSQGFRAQQAALESYGVRVARSSSMAASIAGRVAALLAEARP